MHGLRFVMRAAAAGVLLAGAACVRRPPPDPLETLLADLRREARAMTAFRMAFSQEKRLPELARPIRISGTLWGRVDAEGLWLRLDTDFPEPSSVLVTPREVLIHSVRERQLERADLDHAPVFAALARGLFCLYAADREALSAQFDAEMTGQDGETRELSLRARGGGKWEGIEDAIRIVWEGKRPRLSALAFSTDRGETVAWRFSDPAGSDGRDDRFQLEVPPGTEKVDLTGLTR